MRIGLVIDLGFCDHAPPISASSTRRCTSTRSAICTSTCDSRPESSIALFRTEDGTTPGSGLGLSLVKAVADLHGATIRLVDNGPGLRVVVRFPWDAPR